MDNGLDWSDVLGLLGVFIYITSYFALQAGLIKGQGYLYALLNTGAASCVLLSLTENFNLSSAIIQITYIAISVFGIVRFYLLTHSIQFNPEEQAFLDVAAPNIPKFQARRLLDQGHWKTDMPDTILTEEGEALTHLYFLYQGGADVVFDGKKVAQIGSRSLIGEMSWMTGMPASATVTVSEPSRVFALEVEKLKTFLVRNMNVRHELENRFASQLSEKLVRANTALSSAQQS